MTGTVGSMGSPERVLVLITKLDRGGAETMSMNYYRHFDRSKIQYDFMVNREEEGAYEAEIRQLGGRIFRMSPMYPQYFNRYKREFRDFLRAHPEYRIIHSNLEERSYFPLKVASEEDIPVRIAHAHNEYLTYDIKTVVRNYFRHRLPRYITQGFACSGSAGTWLFGDALMSSNKIKIVKNAIDLQRYDYMPEERGKKRQELNIPDDELVIGSVGRLATQKNQVFLLDVFAEISKRRPQCSLLLVGEGELRDQLMHKSEDLGIEKNVRFVGSVPDTWSYLQAMDVFVLPSLYEGLPLSLVEAQATGLPCYASDTVSRDADITGHVVFMSLDQPVGSWADKILQTRMGRRSGCAAEVKAAHFDIDDEARKLQNFYLNTIS
jgi:glycosyltransferase involved in cell wall biosynthesis